MSASERPPGLLLLSVSADEGSPNSSPQDPRPAARDDRWNVKSHHGATTGHLRRGSVAMQLYSASLHGKRSTEDRSWTESRSWRKPQPGDSLLPVLCSGAPLSALCAQYAVRTLRYTVSVESGGQTLAKSPSVLSPLFPSAMHPEKTPLRRHSTKSVWPIRRAFG